MSLSRCWFKQRMVCSLVITMAVRFAGAAPAPPLQATTRQQSPEVPCTQIHLQYSHSQDWNVDDVGRSPSEAEYPDNPEPVHSLSADQSGESNVPPSGAEQPPPCSVRKPLGTAVGPFEKSTGVAASRPAGAVIAPAKQRHARSILIRVGVVVGAAAAIGIVVLLSRASPSRPY